MENINQDIYLRSHPVFYHPTTSSAQYCLDTELEKQYAAYLSELETQSKQFYALIDHAFAPDFRTAFLHSILLANAAGVKKAEILSSVEDIDSFFLN